MLQCWPQGWPQASGLFRATAPYVQGDGVQAASHVTPSPCSVSGRRLSGRWRASTPTCRAARSSSNRSRSSRCGPRNHTTTAPRQLPPARASRRPAPPPAGLPAASSPRRPPPTPPTAHAAHRPRRLICSSSAAPCLQPACQHRPPPPPPPPPFPTPHRTHQTPSLHPCLAPGAAREHAARTGDACDRRLRLRGG